MLDAVMYPINMISIKFDDDPIPPAGIELSLSRDDDMIVWKKALNPRYGVVIVKLRIPQDAAILFTPTKCRANRAIVLGFYVPCTYNGDEPYQLNIPYAVSWYDHTYTYKLGEEIVPDYFDPDWHKTCSHGIHFFITFDEAVNYVF